MRQIVRRYNTDMELMACGHLLPVLYYHKGMGYRRRRRCMKCLYRKRRDVIPKEAERGEGTMGHYTVTVEQVRHYTLEVEAATIEEASTKAKQADLDQVGADAEIMGQEVIEARRDDA